MLLSVIAASAFEELGIGASVLSDGVWHSIHFVPNVAAFEVELGHDLPRWAHNDRCIARAQVTGRLVRGEHAGFCDLFVPMKTGGAYNSVLVVGPFAIRRPTSVEVIDRWHALSGARGYLGDHAFSRYLNETLATLTLEGPLLGAFERMVICCASLLGGTGDPEKLGAEARALKQRVLEARSAKRIWEDARSMVDERTTRAWLTPLKRDPLAWLGMDRPPGHAIVGLMRGRSDELDPVDEALRLYDAQRAILDLARQRDNVVSGQVGDRGITLLSASPANGARARSVLLDLAARAQDVARRLGFRLHAGIAPAAPPQTLAARYVGALAAAERALSRGQSVQFADDRPEPSARRLAHLRSRLAEAVEGSPALLLPRFEQYLEAVAVHAGHQLDVTRAYLEAGFERLAEPLLASGWLDRRTFNDLYTSLHGPSTSDGTLADLLGAYRSAVADIERAIQIPTQARQDRSVRRALAFIREHVAEPLTLPQVARVAGFAPAYFSRLLKRREGLTLDPYLQRLRLTRAQEMLAGSSLSVGRVARLSGFRSRTYFQQLFRRRTGMTPIEYRRQSLSFRRERT